MEEKNQLNGITVGLLNESLTEGMNGMKSVNK